VDCLVDGKVEYIDGCFSETFSSMAATLLCFDSGSGGSVLSRMATEDLVQLTGMSPALAGRDSTSGFPVKR